jgi:transposase
MSLQPQQPPPVPEETAHVARAAFPKGNVYMRMRDELGVIYHDEAFRHLFPSRGRPAEAPWQLALVTVMQFAEGLPDRQAADAVRGRIDWKYALGLALTDDGFDRSVLSEFRARLIAGGAERRLLDALLERLGQLGLVKARGRQRTDSTHVLAAIRTLNRLELVGETLRAALNALAVAAPGWLRATAPAEWYERYATRFENARLPTKQTERDTLAETIGADGYKLLAAVSAPGAPGWLQQVPAVEVLRQVWIQQYYAPDPPAGGARFRAAPDLPPAARAISSPYDTAARYSAKRGTEWVGCKVHLTETCEPDTPHLLTNVETSEATTPDVGVTAGVHTALAAKGLLPGEHLADTGYLDAGLLVESRTVHGVDLLGPVLPDHSWQAKAGQGFDLAAFHIDWDAQVATCPAGRTSRYWVPQHDPHGEPCMQIWFDKADCLACARRSDCTRSPTTPRTLRLQPKERQQALQGARQRQTTEEFKRRYACRAGVEGTISQGTRAFGLRHARYIGLAKTRLQHIATAAAINLARPADWWTGSALAQTRVSQFARLAAVG